MDLPVEVDPKVFVFKTSLVRHFLQALKDFSLTSLGRLCHTLEAPVSKGLLIK